jgi:biopolymer transport protein ExbB
MQRKFVMRSRLNLRMLRPIGSCAIMLIAALMLARAATAMAADAPADQPTTAPAATATDTPSLSPLELISKAGYFIYPLALCSILAVAIIIERFIALQRRKVIPAGFLAGLKGVSQDPVEDREQALRYCEQNDSALARIIAAGIRRLPRGVAAAEKSMEDAGANESLKLRQNLRFLYSMGNVATLLGLIGTISGMIHAFHVASVLGPGHEDKLSEGIYEAMVNTFAGLAIAIVVTVFYYFLVGRIERLVTELSDAANEFGRMAGFDEAATAEKSAAGL